LTGSGRLWLLFTFALLAPVQAPDDSLIQLLVYLTRRVQEENREDFFKGPHGLYQQLDVGLLHLGLTYGKLGLEMDYLSEMIKSSWVNDLPLLKRYVRGLAAIGLYYPDAALGLLDQALADQLEQEDLKEVAVKTLATIGVIHNDKVERFLLKIGMDERFRAEVQAREDASLVKRYVDVVGLYNATAYGCLFYPRMRRMAQRVFQAFTESENLTELVSKTTQAYIRLVVESDYRISGMIVQEETR
jgi:hypothetical protein